MTLQAHFLLAPGSSHDNLTVFGNGEVVVKLCKSTSVVEGGTSMEIDKTVGSTSYTVEVKMKRLVDWRCGCVYRSDLVSLTFFEKSHIVALFDP